MSDASAALTIPRKSRALPSLRRITTSGTYIPEIDGLRFAAILAVVCFHVPVQISFDHQHLQWFWSIIGSGKRGVQLFFVISGFILALPFAGHLLQGKKPVVLKKYFLRRVTRLEPPYILAILIRLPLLVLAMHRPISYVLTRGLASLFYVHSLVYGQMSVVNPPAWSLEVEIQFYCLAPLLAYTYFRVRPTWLRRLAGVLFIVLAGALQFHFGLSNSSGRFQLSILNYVQYFFAGFLLCDLYLVGWDSIPRSWIWDVVSIALWIWIFSFNSAISLIAFPLAILVAYLGAFKGYICRAFFRLPWISVIGGMCYSIYLTHNLAITGIAMLLNKFTNYSHWSEVLRIAGTYAAIFPATFLAGLLLYLTVERPCMDKDWPRKLWAWGCQRFNYQALRENA